MLESESILDEDSDALIAFSYSLLFIHIWPTRYKTLSCWSDRVQQLFMFLWCWTQANLLPCLLLGCYKLTRSFIHYPYSGCEREGRGNLLFDPPFSQCRDQSGMNWKPGLKDSELSVSLSPLYLPPLIPAYLVHTLLKFCSQHRLYEKTLVCKFCLIIGEH